MKVLALSGSLRKESFNTKLLHAACECLSGEAEVVFADCAGVPLYNSDIDNEVKPEPVANLLRVIAGCDGILIATPEYNYSIPGVLKNTIDWVSRPAYKSVLVGKPTGILSAAKGPVGGAQSQGHLRQVFSATLTPVVPSPPFFLPMAQDKFDDGGALIDDGVRHRLDRYMQDFIAWVTLLSGRP